MQVTFRDGKRIYRQLFRLWFCFLLGIVFFGISVASAASKADEEPKIIVLNYHKIDFYNNPLSVTPTEFEQQMSYFKTYNFHVVSLDQIYDYLQNGTQLPTKPVAITFDDGYLDNYTYAFPILQKYGYPATIFAITSLVGKKGYITWEQAREMAKNGISIQSHTVNHRPLSTQSNDNVMTELQTSREIIEKEVGEPVKYVAYPEGYYNNLTEQIVKAAGYRGALTIRQGKADKLSNPYALERTPIFHTTATFRDFMRRIHFTPGFAQTGWLP